MSHLDVQSGGLSAVVQYAYEAQEGNEIDLQEGEVITQIEQIDDR